MDFVKHPQHTRFIGKPRDWVEAVSGPCGALSVHDTKSNGYPVMESAWQPSLEEALAMATGYSQIRLGIFGTSHPVVYMGTSPTTPTSREDYVAKIKQAAEWLVTLAQQGGLDICVFDGQVSVKENS